MITIALPNKGRLSEKALGLFERAGLRAEFTSERALVAALGNEFRAIFVRAADVPEFVADGAADAGGGDTGLAGDKAADDGYGLPQGFGDNGVDADLSWRLGGGLGLFLLRR